MHWYLGIGVMVIGILIIIPYIIEYCVKELKQRRQCCMVCQSKIENI